MQKPRQPWYSWYAAVAAVVGLPGAGSWSSVSPPWPDHDFASGTYTPQVRSGINLSAYFVPDPHGHIGLYGRYLTGPSDMTVSGTDNHARVFASDWGLGVSLKLGGRPVDSLWLGGIFEVGGVSFRSDRNDSAILEQSGFDGGIRLALDWIMTPPGGFRVGLTASAGFEFAMIYLDDDVRSDSDIQTTWDWLQPVVLVGVLFGG
ncbi:MAG: hypothetical protein PHU25_15260 [Deltaproteobacteria bacterium]|nr:hypothetical protein [Deltaproteobacteria bacterium]